MAHFYTWPSVGLLLTVVREGGREKKRQRRNRRDSEQLPPWNFWISARQWRVLEGGIQFLDRLWDRYVVILAALRALCFVIPPFFFRFESSFFFLESVYCVPRAFSFQGSWKSVFPPPPLTRIQHNNAHRELGNLSCSNFSVFFKCVPLLPSLWLFYYCCANETERGWHVTNVQ